MLSQFAIHGFESGFVIFFVGWCTQKLFFVAQKVMRG